MDATLFLIRHGEPEGPAGRWLGSLDAPLSQHGRRQMQEVAADLMDVPLAAVYCSDLQRSAASAAIVAVPHGLTPVVVPGLRERGFGSWEGLVWDEVLARDPAGAARWSQDPLAFRPAGGETLEEVEARVHAAFDAIAAAHPAGDFAVVAHGGVNRVLLARFLGMPRERLFAIAQGYAALSVVRFHGGSPVVHTVNGRGGDSCRATG